MECGWWLSSTYVRTFGPSESNNSGSSPKNTARLLCGPNRWAWQKTVFLSELSLSQAALSYCSSKIYSQCSLCTLIDTFTKKMSAASRRSLRSQYALPQNDLTTAPFLNAVMGSECSKPCNQWTTLLSAQHLEVLTHILQSHPSMLGVYHQHWQIGDVPKSGTTISGHVGKHQYFAC